MVFVNEGPEMGLCSRECGLEPCLWVVSVNEGSEMGCCSQGCSTECCVDGVFVNMRSVEAMLFTRVWPGVVSKGGACEQGLEM